MPTIKKQPIGRSARPGPDWTSWLGLALTNVSDLTDDHLRLAIGLESAHTCDVPGLFEQVPEINVKRINNKGKRKAVRSEDEDDPIGVDDTSDEVGQKRKRGRQTARPMVKKCRKKGCEDNLLCFNHLGIEAWLVKDAEFNFHKLHGLGYDPTADVRQANTPVGLRNLGATCYANAFLQVWYANELIRSAVYKCAASLLPSDFKSPMYQLALTFAALELSQQKVYDPSGLVDALLLEKGNQQDASEFSKLFMSLIADEFAKREDLGLNNLIHDQFGGKLQYATKCLTCGKISSRCEDFLELEISLADKVCRLEERLRLLFAPEILDGDNKYRCSHCDSLQPASRACAIQSLPPTLHLSLLRFIYDPKSGTRKKSKTSLTFPKEIEMGEFMQGGGTEGTKYQLSGVVEHMGTSAHHGHFTCRVYNSDLGEWYLCDDESCEKIKSMGPMPERSLENLNESVIVVDRSSEDDAIDCLKDARKVNKKAVFPAKVARQEPAPHSSSNIYMLIYSRKEASVVSKTPPTPRTTPGTGLTKIIQQLNSRHALKIDTYEQRKQHLKTIFEGVREKKVEAVRASAQLAARDVKGGYFIDYDQLRSWIGQGIEAFPKNGTRDDRMTPISKDDTILRGMSSSGGKMTVDQNDDVPQLNGDNHAAPLTHTSHNGSDTIIHDTYDHIEDHNNDFTTITILTKPEESQKSSPNDHTKREQSVERPASPICDDKVRERCLHTIFDSSARLCPHGMLHPLNVTKLRIISEKTATILETLGCDDCKRLPVDDVACEECFAEVVANRLDQSKHKQDLAEFHQLLRLGTEDLVMSSSWLNAWEADPSSSMLRSEAFIAKSLADMTCPHGKTRPAVLCEEEQRVLSAEAFSHLESVFTEARIPVMMPSQGSCAECHSLAEAKDRSNAQASQAIKMEKNRLMKLLSRKTLNNRRDHMVYNTPYHVVPMSFVQEWKRHIGDPEGIPRPVLSMDALFCEHGLLNLDPSFNPDMASNRVLLLDEMGWKALTGFYGHPNHNIVIESLSLAKMKSSVQTCSTCWKAKRSAATDFTITIFMLDDNDPDAGPAPSLAMESEAAEDSQSGAHVRSSKNGVSNKKTTTYGTPARRSNRQMQSNSARHKRFEMAVETSDSILQVKQEIEIVWRIVPFYQRLYFRGEELTDGEVTIGHLGILEGDIVHLRNAVINEDFDIISEPDGVPANGNRVDERDGFGGTLLSGGLTKGSLVDGSMIATVATSSPATEALDDNSTENLECVACTFLNPLRSSQCEMCGSAFT